MKELKELSLAIKTVQGIALRISLQRRPRSILISTSSRALHDSYKVGDIAPGQCIGEPMFAALQSTFADQYLYAGLGTTLDLRAEPQVVLDRRGAAIPDASELRVYRRLLALSDDASENEPKVVQLAQAD